MEGVFIAGIDTGVGKTALCAGILKLLHGSRKALYWKPVQCGTIVSDDTRDVKALSDLGDEYFMEPAYRFAEPMSPHLAAKKWGKTIDLDVMTKQFTEAKKSGAFVIVEGAGGLLVPFAEDVLQIDLIKRLKLPVLFVAEDRVGAINQSLLALRVSREEKVPVLGVVLTRSRRILGNAESITHFGKVELIAEFDPADDVKTLVAQMGGDARLRKLFNVPTLPL